MAGYDLRYVGLDRLPSKLSEFDLDHYFSLSQADVAAVKERFRSDNRVGAAVQLLFLRACGRTLDQAGTIPRLLLKQAGMALGLPNPSIASLRTLYTREKTRRDHQTWAREYLKLQPFGAPEQALLKEWMDKQAAEALSLDELVQLANVWLYEQRILIPAERTLRDLAYTAWNTIEKQLLKTLREVIPEAAIAKVEAALAERHRDGAMTVLEWLKTPPRRHSPSTLAETLKKVRFLKELGVHTWPLDMAPITRQRAYAQKLQARRPAKTRELKATTRLIELVFFLHITLLELTDSTLYQTGRRIADLVRHADGRTREKQAKSAVSYRQRLLDVHGVAQDKTRTPKQRLAAIVEMLADVVAKPAISHAATVRESLLDDGHRVRALLSSLKDLEFMGSAKDQSLPQLALIRALHASNATELPEATDIAVNPAWQELVAGPDRQRALKALEACTVLGLRKGLRHGAVWINHSLSFRERDELLIPPAQWAAERQRYIDQYQLPASAEAFLEKLSANIQVGLAALDEACAAGKVTIDAQGDIHIGDLEALPDDPLPRRTRDLLFKDIGDVQLPDLLLEMDAHTNFSEILLGRRASDDDELIALYAALLAHGTEIDAKGVAAMIPQLDPARVSVAMRSLEAQGRLRRANERVVEFQRRHPITELWGNGETASSDMMSLDVSKHLYYARVDPRRRTHGAGFYTHILNQHGIIYDQPHVLNERQVGVAIEGAVRHNEVRDDGQLLRLAVDTHGYVVIWTFLGSLTILSLRKLRKESHSLRDRGDRHASKKGGFCRRPSLHSANGWEWSGDRCRHGVSTLPGCPRLFAQHPDRLCA